MSDAVPSADRWTAAHCRVLGRLFSILGAAGATGDDDAAIVLTSLAGQLAWHAELLGDLLPTRDGHDAASLVAEPAPGADEVADRLDALRADGDTATLCVVLARVVVPRLLAGVEDARARTDARLDGPRARALTLIVRDLTDALGALEPLCERALASPGGLDAAVRQWSEAEHDVVAAGAELGIVGEQSDRRG